MRAGWMQEGRRAAPLGVLAIAAALLAAIVWLSAPERSERLGQGSRAQASASQQPDILVVMTDDQTVADLEGMPRVRRSIAASGVSFSESFVSWPVCCPSRATFLTGRYAHNHGVRGLSPPSGGYGRLDRRHTLPVWLDRVGYRTAHVGKFLNGYGSDEPADVPPGWDDWHATVDPSTYRMWGYTLNENGRKRTYGSVDGPEYPPLYQTDVLTQKAIGAIDRAPAGSPLFLSVAYVAPHHEGDRIRPQSNRSIRPAPRHLGALADLPLPRPASFDEANLADKPSYLRRRLAPLDDDTVARVTRNFRARREALLAVDEGVAGILRRLETRRQRPLYVLFTSDNGFLQGEHRVASGKLLPYDPSAAVPLLIRGPGLPRGRTSGELVANTDLAPTILELGRARADRPVDGRSLLAFARDPRRRTRRPILHETGGLTAGDPDPDGGPIRIQRTLTYQAVRTDRFLYVEHRNGGRELYDSRHDPGQLVSRHSDPDYAATREALAGELERLIDCGGAQCTAAGAPVPEPEGGHAAR